MPDSLNARMAAALAPVLGEEAVYELGPCPQGHGRTGQVSGDWCHECVHSAAECAEEDWDGQDGWCEQMRLLMEADLSIHPEWRYRRTPKDFADPAVGWGGLERYLKATSSYLTLDHNTEGSVFEAHVFPDLAYQFVHEGYADTAWGAVIMAWARAMGVGEVSGDA